jgi:hypothetical protein
MIGGRLRVRGNFSRVGVQEYTRSDGSIIRENRPPSEVFSDASLASLAGMPVTIRHPREGMVSPQSWSRLGKGQTGDTVAKADDGRHTTGTIWLQDAEAIKRVQSGELVELSVGYEAHLDETPGVNEFGEKYDAQQRDIRGNHIALLGPGEARGGSTVALRLDSSGDAVVNIEEEPAQSALKKEIFNMADITIKADGKTFTVQADSDEAARAVETERARLIKEQDELKAKLESSADVISDLEKKLDAATKPEAIAQIADARAQLVAEAKMLSPEMSFETQDAEGRKRPKTDQEIMVTALTDAKHGVSSDSPDYIRARFDTMVEISKETKKQDSTRRMDDVRTSLVDQNGNNGTAACTDSFKL